MNFNLDSKTALVCGSTQGIGKAVAIELAKSGANVILLARDENKLQAVRNVLAKNKDQHHDYVVADFSNSVQFNAAILQIKDRHPLIHILVNNTGGPPAGLISNASTDEFVSAFTNHVLANHLLTQAVLPGMKTEKYGRIINIISTSVKQPIPGLGVSNTIRAAVGNWAKTLAGEVAASGITVNNVLPGATNTLRLQNIIENKAKNSGKSIEHIKEEMVHEIPAKRFAEPFEIASVVAFLASSAAAYVNGINIPVDGGRTLSL